MRNVPTGHRVVFATPLPERLHEEDIDALDPLLGLDLANTAGSDHYDDRALPRDEAEGDPSEIGTESSPTVTERLDGLMPSVAVLRQMIEEAVAFDLRERLAGGQTTVLLLRYPMSFGVQN